MMETFLAYMDKHSWAQWAFAALLVGPPVLLAAARGKILCVGETTGWVALIIALLVLLVP